MKILIAGDSYALNIGWPRYLKKLMPCDITNIAKGGTSLAYTYKRLKYYIDNANFDKIIIFVTTKTRIDLKNTYGEDNTVDPYKIVNYLPNVLDNISKLNRNDPLYEQLIAVVYYYEYLYSPIVSECTHEAILEELTAMIPKEKLILLPSFKQPDSCEKYFTTNFIGIQASSREVGMSDDDYPEWYHKHIELESHSSHLIPANQRKLADHIMNIIMYPDKQIFNYDQIEQIKDEDIKLYYKKK